MKRFTLLLLVLSIVFSLYLPSSASEEIEISCSLNGNTGAVITAPEGAVASTESDLVALTQNGNEIVVTAKGAAVGIAEVKVTYNEACEFFAIPVGYTTFVFDGDKLTVIEGSSDKYEISGINTLGEEYLVDALDCVLPYTVDADGNQVFENTDTYSINVGIKKKGGRFVFYGQSDDMTVTVKKQASGASYLYLCGLELGSSFTSPITVKKDSTAKCYITACEGFYNKLSDNPKNNADLYGDPLEGGDGTNLEYAESACIKGKDYADIILCGKGRLELECVTGNAIKVNEYGNLTVEELSLDINSAQHGISCNNILTINSGNISINAKGDGIRCDPDEVDAELGLASFVTVNGGVISVNAGSDGFQSAQDIIIDGGVFNIKSIGKGIKSAYIGADTETADPAALTQSILINDGTFYIDSLEDGLHSSALITVTAGYFDIRAGDDAMRADAALTVGNEGSEAGPSVCIYECTEGLDSPVINNYGGLCYIYGKDAEASEHSYELTVDIPKGNIAPELKFYLCSDCGLCYGESGEWEISYEEAPVPVDFPDVKEGVWYYDAVQYCAGKGIFNGNKDGSFAPTKNITRAEFVVVLANYSGEDISGEECEKFTDVKSDYWYYNAMSWAANRGIVSGVGNGLFAPTRPITRQDLCLMLKNYLDYKNIAVTIDTDKPFADDGKIGSWAKDAVYTVRGAGVVSGMGDNIFAPRGNATRAQVAQMMMQFDKFAKNK